MSEREELAEAIELVESWHMATSGYVGPRSKLVFAAARKHLDALPKTRTEWRVSHKAGDFVVRATWRTTDTEDDAMDSAAYALRCGKRNVCVDKVEVPA